MLFIARAIKSILDLSRIAIVKAKPCVRLVTLLDVKACSYDLSADYDDGSCVYPGCTDPTASNYDYFAGCGDGSCVAYVAEGCPLDGTYYTDATPASPGLTAELGCVYGGEWVS